MTDKQKETRKIVRQRIKQLISESKLKTSDDNYTSVSTVEEIINQTPIYDLSSSDKDKFLNELYKHHND